MKDVSAFDISLKKLSWDKLFDSEAELVEAMMNCPSERTNSRHGLVPTGYGYIASFKRYYAKNGCLTDKQMTQLKRLAKSVYVGFRGMNVGGYIAMCW